MRRNELAKHLNDITPAQLETYMLSHGWFRDGDFKGLASIWHRSGTDQSDAEILLPNSASAQDFTDRMVDAVIAISQFEDRSFPTVLKEVMGHFADLVRIRVFHSDVDAGTIPINDGVLLNIRARDLMASAVMSTASKRRHFMGKRSPEVKEYINSLRLGQTEVGSYIVNIIAPVGPSQSDQGSFEDIPLSNIVTANLASSLEALTFAVNEFSSIGDLTVFDAAVTSGASSNMCDALVGLSGAEKKRGFEISITPSHRPEVVSQIKSFRFDVESVVKIADASAYYKDNYVLPARTVIGSIRRLDRPLNDEAGTITIATMVGELEKHVSIQLGPDEYMDAVNAHKQKAAIQCTGDLHVSARSSKLLNPSGFRVLSNSEFPF
ncbi:Uncharacterized protein ALO63_02431 [Pseudomonas amygdali pv. mori]|uniref:Uncharacterized protein n=1 Tax=Pseudomonas amygdali pv. mori TaxID=34065 RepID=A0A0P9VCP9_PSEA0|nr:Uncharacterized protein ALO63_02431 [Pseudomonas amygdali pv. mori]